MQSLELNSFLRRLTRTVNVLDRWLRCYTCHCGFRTSVAPQIINRRALACLSAALLNNFIPIRWPLPSALARSSRHRLALPPLTSRRLILKLCQERVTGSRSRRCVDLHSVQVVHSFSLVYKPPFRSEFHSFRPLDSTDRSGTPRNCVSQASRRRSLCRLPEPDENTPGLVQPLDSDVASFPLPCRASPFPTSRFTFFLTPVVVVVVVVDKFQAAMETLEFETRQSSMN